MTTFNIYFGKLAIIPTMTKFSFVIVDAAISVFVKISKQKSFVLFVCCIL